MATNDSIDSGFPTSLLVGNLELTANTFSSTNTNGNILISPNGTGAIEISNGTNAIPLQFWNAASSHYVAFQPASVIASNVTWTLPATDSTGTQALLSNGSGTLSWGNSSIATAAVKSDQTTATSISTYVNPAVQQYHPSAVKFSCYFDGTLTGTNAPISGYNVTSVTRNSTGQYTINFTVPFTTANYAVHINAGTTASPCLTIINSLSTTNAGVATVLVSNLLFHDISLVFAMGIGTQ
jgi:hypothetical protein